MVNALHSLLDYMEDEELFLDLAKAGEVSHLCNEHAQDAADVQKGYETLSSDLLALTDIMDTKFKKVRGGLRAQRTHWTCKACGEAQSSLFC